MSVDKRANTSFQCRESLWQDFKDAVHARRISKTDGVEQAIELWLGGQQADPNAEIIRHVRSILARDNEDSKALRVVIDALAAKR